MPASTHPGADLAVLKDLLPELRNDFDVQGLGDYGGPEVQETGKLCMRLTAATINSSSH